MVARTPAKQAGVLTSLQPVAVRDPALDFEFQFLTRPGSSDRQVLEEVIHKHVYRKGFSDGAQFGVARGERWLDLGANIGTFSIWAAAQGCQVVAYEPEAITFRVLQKNLQLLDIGAERVLPQRYAVVSNGMHAESGGEAQLSLANQGAEWRHTLMKKKSDFWQPVQTVPVTLAMHTFRPHGIKADIEGAELAMFDESSFHDALHTLNVRKLVFEYHFDIDRDLGRFRERMARLGGWFDEVRYGTIPAEAVSYDWFPPSRIVYCWRTR
jgi:FkbM family methyltransferase